MLEEEYQLEYFKTQGLTRKVCKSLRFGVLDP